MKVQKKMVPEGFNGPISQPRSAEEAQAWQELNISWWETHPMRYDWKEHLNYEEFSKEFFQEIDRRFFKASLDYAPYSNIPFDIFIHFDELPHKDVLEIGVGN